MSINWMKSTMQFPIRPAIAALLLGCCAVQVVLADDAAKPAEPVSHQITGLFSADRVQDLKEVFAKLPNIKLLKVDFENAEATVEYDPAKAFPGAKPEQIVEQFDNQLRGVSSSTFGVKPLRSIDKEKLKLIEIPVVGLDCKACCLAAYESVYKLKGVERATASFKEGRVTALVNPEMIDRVELEMALKQKGVQLSTP